MTPLTTLPSARDQVHHALTLLGVPATARMIVDVHSAFYLGDLTLALLTRLLRDEERAYDAGTAGRSYHLCAALGADDLAPVRGLVAVSTWPTARRIVTATSARIDALTAVVRIAEFAAVRAGATGAAARLLRALAAEVPGGPEAYDVMNPATLADAARAVLAEPALAEAAAADLVVRRAAAGRSTSRLDARQQLFGVRRLPQQGGRGRARP
jgi:hypothetical protein